MNVCLQASHKDRTDATMSAETRKYAAMYQALLMEQLKLKKWDSVAAVLDSMASAPGMSPTLSQLLAVLEVV